MKIFIICLLFAGSILTGSCASNQGTQDESGMGEEDIAEFEGDDDSFDGDANDGETASNGADDENFGGDEEAGGDEFFNQDEEFESQTSKRGQTKSGISTPSVLDRQVVDLQYQSKVGSGTVVIRTDREVKYTTRRVPERKQFIVELEATSVPQKFQRPYITKEFGGKIDGIRAYQSLESKGAKVVLQVQPGIEPKVRQEGTTIYVSATGDLTGIGIQSQSLAQGGGGASDINGASGAARVEEPFAPRTLDEFLTSQTRFYGKKISIQVKEVEIADVVNMIAEQSGANIVLADEIKGTITLKLRDIPWDQALVVVMRSKNLGYVRQGSVIRIAPLEAIRRETEEAQRIVDSQEKLEKLVVKIIPISYTQVKDMATQVQPLLTTGRGTVSADARSASLIVKDTAETIERVTKLIKYLDTPPAQVLIEGKVVEAQENFKKSVGIQWSNSGFQVDMGNSAAFTSSLNVGPAVKSDGLDLFLNVGTLDVIGDLSARLALSETEGNVKLISSPRVVALNNEKATISQSTEIPLYQYQTDSGGTTTKSVAFKTAKLQLEVTPQITPDGGVMMDIDVVREFLGEIQDKDTQARPMNSRQAKTKVLVKDAQTAVIGGIYQSDVTTSETGVPWLSKIPIIGRIFRVDEDTNNKNELLIFLTPRILNQDKAFLKSETF